MNLQTLSALYVSPMVDLGHILSTKGRGWATDDAENIITDMTRWIDRSAHVLGYLFQLGGFTVIHFNVGSVQAVDESAYDVYPVSLSKGGLGASVVEETPGKGPG